MTFLQQGSSAQVAIAAGQSIAVGAVRGATANVTFPVGYAKGPSDTVVNGTETFGPFATATTVTVYAAQGTAEYVTGTSPVCTDGPVALATDPLTGGKSITAGDINVSKPWDVSAQTRGNVGVRCVATVNTPSFAQAGNTYTWSLAIAIPADAIAVQIISLNAQASTVTGVTGAVSIGATKTDMLNNAGTWTNAAWSGSSTVTLPTATQQAPVFTLSDWIPITPVTSTFSSSAGLPLMMCYARIVTPLANATVSLAGYTASSSAWETIADNNVRGVRFQSGDFVASPSGMTGSSNPQNAPVVGIRYLTGSANAVNVMLMGDSIEFGSGPTITGNSWGHIACNALSTPGRVYSCNNHGYPGQTTSQILTRALTVIPQFKPNIVVFPAFSPNDGTPTQAVINTQLYNIRRIAELCFANGALPVVVQGLPKTTDSTNVASSYTAPQDAFRVALNALSATGAIVYVPHGIGNGASPELYGLAAYTSDGTHPSDAGAAIMATAVQTAITNAGF